MSGLRFESMADMPPRMREAYARQMRDLSGAAAFAEIRKLPAADVAEVVHGQWIKDDFLSDDMNNAEKSSRCGEVIGWLGNLPNYCPNCWAKMDGGDGDAVD